MRSKRIGIADGTVIAAGSRADVEGWSDGHTRRWQLPPGTCVVPGITDAHLHLGMAAWAATGVRLGDLPDRDAVFAAIAAAHAARLETGDHDGWLLGDGWSLDQLDGWPTSADLERLAPADLSRSGATTTTRAGAALLRSRGQASGLPASAVEGSIRRDAGGEPTGVLHEAAATLLDHAIPAPTRDARTAALERYAASLAELGVTGVHDPGDLSVSGSLEGPELYRGLAAEGRLPLRVACSVREAQLDRAIAEGMRTGRGAGRYRDGWLKLFADGALGSRSAALLAPYEAG